MESSMRLAGSSPEEIARRMQAERRSLGEVYKDATPPEHRQQFYDRNMRLYSDPLGPTVDYFRSQGKTWEQIIESAKQPGGQDFGFGQ